MGRFEAVESELGVLGRYELEHAIAEGGMGIVYRARQLSLDRPVAIKVLKTPRGHGKDEAIRRFLAEASLAARISHPNVVGVLDSGAGGDALYIVYQLVEGQSLRQRLSSPLSTGEAIGLAIQTCHAIEAIHLAGAVHRDVKPENLLLEPDGTLKLTDLGIAKDLGRATQTHDGFVFGTPAYMPPEQCRGEPVGPAADIYAVGVLLYEMLAGAPPFSAADPLDVLQAHIDLAPEALSSRNAALPAAWDAIFAKALAKNPAKRYASAFDFAAALEVLARQAASVSAPRPVAQAGAGAGASTRLQGPPRRPAVVSRAAVTSVHPATRGRWRRPLGLAAIGGAAAALLAYGTLSRMAPPAGRPAARAVPAVIPVQAVLPPLLVELPESAVFFGRGPVPARVTLRGVGREGTSHAMKVSGSPGAWRATLLLNSRLSAAPAILTDLSGGKPIEPRLLRISHDPSLRFGDQLTTPADELAVQFYPEIRGRVPRKVLMGSGSLVMKRLLGPESVDRLVDDCGRPPWLDLTLGLDRTPPDLAAFQLWLDTIVRIVEPCLSTLKVAGNVNFDGWTESPRRLIALTELIRSRVARAAPAARVSPGGLSMDTQNRLPSREKAIGGFPWRQAGRFSLYVDDSAGPWAQALEACKRDAVAAGLGDLPWDVTLDRIPSPRSKALQSASPAYAKDVEVREMLRATVLATSAGADRIFLAHLRELRRGPVLLDAIRSLSDFKELSGDSASAFRYVLSRLDKAKPVRAALPAPARGAELELPGRRLSFLWLDDGRHERLRVPVSTPEALVVRVLPLDGWSRATYEPVELMAAEAGHVTVGVDDGLVAIEEVPEAGSIAWRH